MASALSRLLKGFTLTLAGAFVAAIIVPSVQAAEQLNVYTIMPEKYASVILDTFSKDTGVKVNFVRFASGEALARLTAEKKNPQADVLLGGPSDIYEAGVKEALFEPYAPAKSDVPAQYSSPENYWQGYGIMPLVFLTNVEFLKKNGLQAPASWDDLLNPAYKNGLQMADARTSGTATERIYSLVNALGSDDAAFAYQKKLHDNVQLYTKSGQGGAMPIASGQAASGIFYLVDALDILQQGHPVVISSPKEGTTYGLDGNAILSGAKNMASAKKFKDWAASKRFAEVMINNKINYIPVHTGVVSADPIMDMAKYKLFPVESTWKAANRKPYVERWIKEVVE